MAPKRRVQFRDVRPGLVVIALIVSVLQDGCGGQVRIDPGERTVRALHDHRNVSYRYGPIPPTWAPIAIEGNDAAWRDRVTDGVVHVDHSCERVQDAPLPSLVQHLMIGFTEREYETDETIPFDGREARHVVVRARLDGVPMEIELYVMKKDSCVYDLGYVAPPDKFATGAPDFRAFSHGFRTLSTGSPETASGVR